MRRYYSIGSDVIADCLNFTLGCRPKQQQRHDRPAPIIDLRAKIAEWGAWQYLCETYCADIDPPDMTIHAVGVGDGGIDLEYAYYQWAVKSCQHKYNSWLYDVSRERACQANTYLLTLCDETDGYTVHIVGELDKTTFLNLGSPKNVVVSSYRQFKLSNGEPRHHAVTLASVEDIISTSSLVEGRYPVTLPEVANSFI